MHKNFRIKAVAALAVTAALLLAGCGTGTASQTAALPSQGEIAALFPQWNAALATGDPQRVADLYAPNTVLLPTVSNEIRTNRAEIVDYFTKFLQSKPSGRIDRQVITVADPDTAINTGVYTFTMTQNGQRVDVQARFT